MKKIVLYLVIACLLAGCSHIPVGSPVPGKASPATEENWPEEAEKAVPAIILISQSIHLTEPADLSRLVSYDGEEVINGRNCLTFTVYADGAERYENLGFYAKVTGEETYFALDIITNEYRRVIIGDKAIFLEGEEPVAASPYAIEMIMQIYEGDHILEIPAFIIEGESKAADALNAAIIDFAAEAVDEYESGDDVFWAELKAYPFTDENYLQIVITKIIYPNYGTDGEVCSFNYDIAADAVVTIDQAMTDYGLNMPQLEKLFEETVTLEANQTLGEMTVSGFRFLADGGIELILSVTVDNSEAEPWDSIFLYNSINGVFTQYDSNILFPAGVPDKMSPPLYYDNNNLGWCPIPDLDLVDYTCERPLTYVNGINLNETLDSLDALLFTAASFIHSGYTYRTDFDDDESVSFAWMVISYIATHFDEVNGMSFTEQGEGVLPGSVIERYFSAYFYPPAAGVPSVTGDEGVSIDPDSGDTYFMLADGILPTVVVTDIQTDTNEDDVATIRLYADVTWEYPGDVLDIYPVFMELCYNGVAPTFYGLSAVMIAADGENQGDFLSFDSEFAAAIETYPYENETYNYAVNIPLAFELVESNEEGATFAAGDTTLQIIGDWSDIGGGEAMKAAYETAKTEAELTGYLLGSYYESEVGFFFISGGSEGGLFFTIVSQWGKALVTVQMNIYPGHETEYIPVLQRLVSDLLSADIPEDVKAELETYLFN